MQRKFFIPVVLLLLNIVVANAQSARIQSFQEDYRIFEEILRKGHAGLYRYRTAKQVDSIVTHHRHQLTDTTSLVAFYRHLSTILTFIGSLHDDISLPEKITDSLEQEPVFFPLPVKIIEEDFLIDRLGADIPLGSKIIAVNGRSMKDIRVALNKYYTTDGYNLTGKKMGINARFPWYYTLEYGGSSFYEIAIQEPGHDEVQQVTLKGVPYQHYVQQYQQRHSRQFNVQRSKYSFELIDSLSTGILTVHTFSLGGENSAKHKKYKAFLDSCFTLLKSGNIKNLIVDIRQNGGGSDPNDLVTFTYLARHRFKENKNAFTIFQEIPLKQYCIDEPEDITDLEENFREEHNRLRDGKYFQNPRFNKWWKPDVKSFQGKTYLLVAPAVASAASLFASMVKSEGYATVVGEETMGGYYGHTGHNEVNYKLPHTGITVMLSVVDLDQFVIPKKEIPYGRGIMPDITVEQNQQQFIRNEDAVMKAVLDKIKRH